MATAGRLLNSVITEMKAACEPGITTGDLDRLADRLIRKGGARPGFLGYQDFPKSTCISVNDEVVHGIPGKRLIKGGDIVSLDLGLVRNGFWADMACKVAVGRVSLWADRRARGTGADFGGRSGQGGPRASSAPALLARRPSSARRPPNRRRRSTARARPRAPSRCRRTNFRPPQCGSRQRSVGFVTTPGPPTDRSSDPSPGGEPAQLPPRQGRPPFRPPRFGHRCTGPPMRSPLGLGDRVQGTPIRGGRTPVRALQTRSC